MQLFKKKGLEIIIGHALLYFDAKNDGIFSFLDPKNIHFLKNILLWTFKKIMIRLRFLEISEISFNFFICNAIYLQCPAIF